MGKNYWHHQIGIQEIVQLNSIINMVLQSSHSLLFYKIGVLKNFAEFTWKQPRSVTLIKKTPVQVLSCEFCEIFKNPFWQNTSGRLLLDFFHSLNCFLPPSELTETRFFLFLNMFYHGFWTWWISQTLLCETNDLVVAAGKQTFLETAGVKQSFLGWLAY